MSDNPRFHAIFLLILLSLIWGSSFILIKIGLTVFAPDEVAALRVTAASLLMLPVSLAKVRELQNAHVAKLFVSGMLGVFIPAFLFAFAQTRLNSSVAGIMNTLTPLFVVLTGAVFFGQRFRRMTVTGIFLGLAGAVVLILSGARGSIADINVFSLLVVVACISYGANLNLVKYKINDLPALTITSISLLFIGPLAMVYLFGFTGFVTRFTGDTNAWRACGAVVLLGIMSTSVALFLFNRLVKISTPLFTSSVTYLIPIVAVLWGTLDGEKLYIGHYLGMVTILAGVYIANRR